MSLISSAWKFFGQISKRTIFLLVMSFSLLGISLALEKLDSIQHLEKATFATVLWSLATLSELLRELAFALGIAFAVIATVELESRQEFSEAIKRGISEIQHNVFKSTFQRNIPNEIIDEVNELIFGADFVRHIDMVHLEMTITDVHDLDPNLPPQKVIKLE